MMCPLTSDYIRLNRQRNCENQEDPSTRKIIKVSKESPFVEYLRQE